MCDFNQNSSNSSAWLNKILNNCSEMFLLWLNTITQTILLHCTIMNAARAKKRRKNFFSRLPLHKFWNHFREMFFVTVNRICSNISIHLHNIAISAKNRVNNLHKTCFFFYYWLWYLQCSQVIESGPSWCSCVEIN